MEQPPAFEHADNQIPETKHERLPAGVAFGESEIDEIKGLERFKNQLQEVAAWGSDFGSDKPNEADDKLKDKIEEAEQSIAEKVEGLRSRLLLKTESLSGSISFIRFFEEAVNMPSIKEELGSIGAMGLMRPEYELALLFSRNDVSTELLMAIATDYESKFPSSSEDDAAEQENKIFDDSFQFLKSTIDKQSRGISDQMLIAMLENHVDLFEERARQLKEELPVFQETIKKSLLEGAKSGRYKISEEIIERQFADTSVSLLDPLTSDLKESLGDYQRSTNSIRISTFNRTRKEMLHTYTHEAMHSLGRIGLNTWLNEAITERLTLELLNEPVDDPAAAYPLEREELEKMAESNPDLLVAAYDAYFEQDLDSVPLQEQGWDEDPTPIPDPAQQAFMAAMDSYAQEVAGTNERELLMGLRLIEDIGQSIEEKTASKALRP